MQDTRRKILVESLLLAGLNGKQIEIIMRNVNNLINDAIRDNKQVLK